MNTADTLRRRHLDFYVRFAEHHSNAIQDGMDPADRLRRVDAMRAELENIRSALGWAIEHEQLEAALRLSLATNLAWQAGRLWSEGRRWVMRCLAGRSDRDELTARAYRVLGALAAGGGDMKASEDAFRHDLEIRRRIGDEAAIAYSLTALAWRHFERGDIEGGLRLNDEALAIHVKLGDRLGEAINRFQRAWLALSSRDNDSASAEAEHGLRLYEEAGDVREFAYAVPHLASLHRTLGNDAEELRLRRRAVDLARQTTDPDFLVPALADLAETELRLATKPEDIRPLLEEALALARHEPNRSLEARVLSAMASMSAAADDIDAARRFAEHAVETLNDETELGIPAEMVLDSTLAMLSQLEIRAGDLRAALAHAESRHRLAIHGARSWTGLTLWHIAQIAYLRGDIAGELDAFVRSLEVLAKYEDPIMRAHAYVAQVAIALLRGEIEEARMTAERAQDDVGEGVFASIEVNMECLSARVALADGRYDDAIVTSEETASKAEARGELETARGCLQAGADAALKAGRLDKAKRLLDRAAPLSDTHHVPLQTAFVWLTGRWAAAVGHPSSSQLFAAAEAARRSCGLGGPLFAGPTDVTPDRDVNIDAAVEEATRVLTEDFSA
jgi:tetratricopeptide (TPR) repeat protein